MTLGELPRHPLGLPPGSVRGIMCLQIMITAWILLLLPDTMQQPIPLNMYFLLTLVAMFVFGFRRPHLKLPGNPRPEDSPATGNFLRLIIIGGTVAVVVYLSINFPDRLQERLKPPANQLDQWASLLGALLGGLLLGSILKYLPAQENWVFMTIQAWISILSMFTLLGETLFTALIGPQLQQQVNLLTWHFIITFLASTYFGSRM